MPTWRAWVLGIVILGMVFALVVRGAYPFLAMQRPVGADTLVVEGWMVDYGIEDAVERFRAGGYKKVYVTGVPLELGALLSEYKNYANLGAARLRKLGLPAEVVQAVPGPAVPKDRTYVSAVALKYWLREHGEHPKAIDVMTHGPHARRTWMLFNKVLGGEMTVGVIAVKDRGYDARQWWTTSAGFRNVSSECLAYCYAKLFFRASPSATQAVLDAAKRPEAAVAP